MRYVGAVLLMLAAGLAVVVNMFVPDRAGRHRNRVLAELVDQGKAP
jgi:hypothetical protein